MLHTYNTLVGGAPRLLQYRTPCAALHPSIATPVSCCAGAFPEIQVAQYPLDMGRPGAGAKSGAASSSKTLAITVGADGEVNYDAIVKQGRNRDKWVASTQGAMVPKLDKLKDVRSPGLSRTSTNKHPCCHDACRHHIAAIVKALLVTWTLCPVSRFVGGGCDRRMFECACM